MTHPLDQLRQVLSEPLVQVTLGEQRASLHTDSDKGWVWLLQTDPSDWNITRIRRQEPSEFSSLHNQDWRSLAGHMPDEAKSVEIAGPESVASASGDGMWLSILPLADAATVRFVDEDANVVWEYAIAPCRAPKESLRSALSKLNPFSISRGKHTFRSR